MPWSSAGERPRWVTVVAVSIVAGAVTSAIVAPLAGVPVAVASFVALVLRSGRALLALAAVGVLVAVDWIVTSGQATSRYVAEFGWPNHFENAGTLAWLAVAALGADALVQGARQRRWRRSTPADEPGPTPSPPPPSTAPGDATGGGTDTGASPAGRRRGKHVRRS